MKNVIDLTGLKQCLKVNHLEPNPYTPAMTTERIRTTVSIPTEVYDVFVTMAKTQRVSIGRCIGDWLADTAEGAQFVTAKMSQMRSAPTEVMRELHGTIVAEMSQYPANAPVSPRVVIRGVTPPAKVVAKKVKP